jgi:site-specific recombinase XerD
MINDRITDLVPAAGKSSIVASLPDTERARELIQASKAESTLRGYRADWREFYTWCEGQHICPLPASPEAVAAYIADCAERLKVGSIQRRINAIAEAHKAAGLESPTHHPMVTNTMKGIRRTKGTAPAQKAPASTEDIRAMVDSTDTGIIGARDRALILLGFASALRRSELVGLDVDDCAFGKDKDGLTIVLRRSKTDQIGAGRKDRYPVRRESRDVPGAGPSIVDGTDRYQHRTVVSIDLTVRASTGGRPAPIDVARVVKKLAQRAGLDPAKFAGHSLRAGHATSAAIAGASERSIMNQTGHRSVQMVRRYIRYGSLFRENSAGKLGL